MLVTISHITDHLKSAELALVEAERQGQLGAPYKCAAAAQVASAHTKLALAYMYARETSILAAGPDSDQAPLPFE